MQTQTDTTGTWAVYRWPLYDLLNEGRREEYRGTRAECERVASVLADRGGDVEIERVSDADAKPDRVVAALLTIAEASE